MTPSIETSPLVPMPSDINLPVWHGMYHSELCRWIKTLKSLEWISSSKLLAKTVDPSIITKNIWYNIFLSCVCCIFLLLWQNHSLALISSFWYISCKCWLLYALINITILGTQWAVWMSTYIVKYILLTMLYILKVRAKYCIPNNISAIPFHLSNELIPLWAFITDTKLRECLPACKALSHANAKGKGIDSKGWAFRML